MRKIQIMTDSASDISTAEEAKYSIGMIPFPVTLGSAPISAGWTATTSSSMP